MSKAFSTDTWWIVVTNGMTLIGKPATSDGGITKLSPVWELVMLPVQTPEGMAFGRTVRGVAGFDSIESINISTGDVWIPVDSLDQDDRRQIRDIIAGAEELRRQTKAAKAGVLVPRGAGRQMEMPLGPFGGGPREEPQVAQAQVEAEERLRDAAITRNALGSSDEHLANLAEGRPCGLPKVSRK
jgi:hypothetical protein